jgi:hypothetical protein
VKAPCGWVLEARMTCAWNFATCGAQVVERWCFAGISQSQICCSISTAVWCGIWCPHETYRTERPGNHYSALATNAFFVCPCRGAGPPPEVLPVPSGIRYPGVGGAGSADWGPNKRLLRAGPSQIPGVVSCGSVRFGSCRKSLLHVNMVVFHAFLERLQFAPCPCRKACMLAVSCRWSCILEQIADG